MHYPARPPRFLRRPSGLQRASVSLIPPVLELLGPVSARWSLHEVGIGSYTPSEPGILAYRAYIAAQQTVGVVRKASSASCSNIASLPHTPAHSWALGWPC